MANRSYLCCSDLNQLYPSLSKGQYDPAQNTVAGDVFGVPLMWLALFRPADLRTQTLAVDGKQVEVWGTIAPTDIALRQLAQSVPLLNRMLSPNRLDFYASMLAQAIQAVGGKYVTIEWEEIDMLNEPGIFRHDIDEGLSYLASANTVITSFLSRFGPQASSGKQCLLSISRVDPTHPMPSTAGLLGRLTVSDAELENLCRLLGASWIRPVPWEVIVPRPQTPDRIARSEQIKAEVSRQTQKRKALEAQRDAKITDQVCPHCGKPCPTYRKTCKHCGLKVGNG